MSARRVVPAPESEPLASLDEVLAKRPTLQAPPSHAPSLIAATATLAAMGALHARVDDPHCGATRIDEIRAHAPAIRASLSRGTLAVDEVRRAIGLKFHPIETGSCRLAMDPEYLDIPEHAHSNEMNYGAAAWVQQNAPPASPAGAASDLLLSQGSVRRVEPTPIARPENSEE